MILLLPIMDYVVKLSVYLWFFPYSMIGNSNNLEKIVKYNLDGINPNIFE